MLGGRRVRVKTLLERLLLVLGDPLVALLVRVHLEDSRGMRGLQEERGRERQ